MPTYSRGGCIIPGSKYDDEVILYVAGVQPNTHRTDLS